MSQNRKRAEEKESTSFQTLTVEELLAELTLLTDTDVIPPNQLLALIAKSHVALTAQFVEFQKRQATENHELRMAMLELSTGVNERLEPRKLTRILAKENRNIIFVRSILLPIAVTLALVVTHVEDIQHLWEGFVHHSSSIYGALLMVIALFTMPGIAIYYVYTNRKS